VFHIKLVWQVDVHHFAGKSRKGLPGAGAQQQEGPSSVISFHLLLDPQNMFMMNPKIFKVNNLYERFVYKKQKIKSKAIYITNILI